MLHFHWRKMVLLSLSFFNDAYVSLIVMYLNTSKTSHLIMCSSIHNSSFGWVCDFHLNFHVMDFFSSFPVPRLVGNGQESLMKHWLTMHWLSTQRLEIEQENPIQNSLQKEWLKKKQQFIICQSYKLNSKFYYLWIERVKRIACKND